MLNDEERTYALLMLNDEELADALHSSREYLEQHGLAKGTFRTADGRVCGMGAVMISQGWYYRSVDEDRLVPAAGVSRHIAQVLEAAYRTVGDLEPDDVFVIDDFTHWNDSGRRTQQEVLDAFAAAEKIVRAGFDPEKGITDDQLTDG